MKSYEMKTLTAYKVIKSSTDQTIEVGDTIWLSENKMLNSIVGCGFLSEEEWNDAGVNDFEVELCQEYCVLKVGRSESLIKSAALPFFHYREMWIALEKELNRIENELLNIKKEKDSEAEKNRIQAKLSGLRIAKEQMLRLNGEID